MTPGLLIGILTATSWESRVVRSVLSRYPVVSGASARRGVRQCGRHRVMVIQTGMGPAKARQACLDLCATERVDLIVVAGFIGALQPAEIGALIVARSVESSPPWPSTVPFVDRLPCSMGLAHYAVDHGKALDISVVLGPIVSVGRVVASAEDKQELAKKTGAIGVDMESAAIGDVAREQRCPFLVVRAITDGVDEDLPIDFNLFASPSGWVKGMAMLMDHRRMRGLCQLKRSVEKASSALIRFFDSFFDAVDREVLRDDRNLLA